VQSPVGPHSESGAQLLLAIGRSDRRNDHFLGAPALLDPQGLLKRDLVKGIDAHLYAIRDDARAIRLDADAHVVVHNALDTDQNSLHSPSPGKRLHGQKLALRQYSGRAR